MSKKVIFLTVVFFILMLISSYNLPILETTNARYSEISREMLRSRNYIEPVLNGIKHFHKPPLSYWFISAGIKIFGINGLGPRFFGILFAALTLIITYYMALLIMKKKEYAENSSFILASSFLFIGVSSVVSTDIYLTFFTTTSLYFIFRQSCKKDIINSILLGIMTGLGFMTKGPVIFLFTFLPYLIIKIVSKEKSIFNTKELFLITVMFIIFGLTWYIYVIMKNKDLLLYFIKFHTVERVLTSKFHRNQPFYFFIIIFFLSFYPYSIFYIKKLYDDIKTKPNNFLNHTYIVFPFIFFSFSKSKLMTYILPFYPILSILISDKAEHFFKETKTGKYTIKSFFIISFVFLVFPLKYPELKGSIYIFITLSLFFFFISYSLSKNFSLFRFSIFIILLSFSIYMIIPYIENFKGSYKQFVEKINIVDPDKKLKILTYRCFLPSISFYMDEIVTTALSAERETRFESDKKYKDYYLTNDEEVDNFLSKNPQIFVITRGKDIIDIEKRNFSCKKIYIKKELNLYLCSKNSR